MNTDIRVALPRYAEYNSAFKFLIEQGLDVQCLVPPPLTQHTMDVGAKNSPDFVCTPFKTTLGSMIEALDAGATTLAMFHGLCKLGYYGELQEQILRDMGYEFNFVNLTNYSTGKKRDLLGFIKDVNPQAKYRKFVHALFDAFKMVECIDDLTAHYFQNCGFALDAHAYRQAYQSCLDDFYTAQTRADIEAKYQAGMQALQALPVDKPASPLRVGIVGDFYTAMDAFSNLEAEQKLADFGVEVHRWMNFTNRVVRYPDQSKLQPDVQEYCTYEMGPTSTSNIWAAKDFAERGFDGIVHIKSANCTPEIDIMPALQRMGSVYKIPVLYLTYDAQTSDVGLMTRLEAFYDMIAMRRGATDRKATER